MDAIMLWNAVKRLETAISDMYGVVKRSVFVDASKFTHDWEYAEYDGDKYYRISDLTPAAVDLIGTTVEMTLSVFPEPQLIELTAEMVIETEYGLSLMNGLFAVFHNDAQGVAPGFYVTEFGLSEMYPVSATATFRWEEIKQIDPKFIPALPGGVKYVPVEHDQMTPVDGLVTVYVDALQPYVDALDNGGCIGLKVLNFMGTGQPCFCLAHLATYDPSMGIALNVLTPMSNEITQVLVTEAEQA